MRVLHLLASPYFSGPAELVLQLALAQRALGHRVEVAVDRRRAETPAEELAAPRFAEHSLLSELPLELSVKEKQTVNIPVWAGVGAIVVGAALLAFGGGKR